MYLREGRVSINKVAKFHDYQPGSFPEGTKPLMVMALNEVYSSLFISNVYTIGTEILSFG